MPLEGDRELVLKIILAMVLSSDLKKVSLLETRIRRAKSKRRVTYAFCYTVLTILLIQRQCHFSNKHEQKPTSPTHATATQLSTKFSTAAFEPWRRDKNLLGISTVVNSSRPLSNSTSSH
jgi:hypothetical protein